MRALLRRLAVTVGLAAGLCGVTASAMAASPALAVAPASHSVAASDSVAASHVGAAASINPGQPITARTVSNSAPPSGYYRKGAYYTDTRGTADDKCAFAGDSGINDKLWRDWWCWRTAPGHITELWYRP